MTEPSKTIFLPKESSRREHIAKESSRREHIAKESPSKEVTSYSSSIYKNNVTQDIDETQDSISTLAAINTTLQQFGERIARLENPPHQAEKKIPPPHQEPDKESIKSRNQPAHIEERKGHNTQRSRDIGCFKCQGHEHYARDSLNQKVRICKTSLGTATLSDELPSDVSMQSIPYFELSIPNNTFLDQSLSSDKNPSAFSSTDLFPWAFGLTLKNFSTIIPIKDIHRDRISSD